MTSAGTRKSLDEIKSLASNASNRWRSWPPPKPQPCWRKFREKNGRKLVVRTFSDRDLNFLKLLAQRLTRQAASIALLATSSPQPALSSRNPPASRTTWPIC